MTWLLFADDDRAAAARSSNLRTYYDSLGFRVLEDRFFCLPLFLNALPFNADPEAVQQSWRYRSMASIHAAHLLPICADWKGTGTPILTYVGRNGQLASLDFYDSPTNYNFVMAAESGAGKSVAVNDIVLNYLSIGGKVWIIDNGRSYEKLTAAVGGDFVEIRPGLCFNPFPLIHDYDEEADSLVGLLAAMAAPTSSLTDLQNAELRRVLRECWDAHEHALTVDLVAEALQADEDPRVQDIGRQLYPFTAKGEYGTWFNGPNNVAFSNRLTVLELEGLKGRKHLQKVLLLQLFNQIQYEMYKSGDKTTPKLVLADESWEHLKEGDSSTFFEVAYRTVRKYHGVVGIVLQSINDLYESATGRVIAENSAHKFLLGQTSEALEIAKQNHRLPLTDAGYDLCRGLHTVPGLYSELFVLTKHGGGAVRLILDRFSQLLTTTRGPEVEAIMTEVRHGRSMVDAIEMVMAREAA